MPELPEVETIVRDLRTKVLKRTFVGAWTDFAKMIKEPEGFENFKRQLEGKKIIKIRRRGKNIIFDLTEGFSLLVHQKLTGHLLEGVWNMKNKKWIPQGNSFLKDRVNTYIHLMMFLDNGRMLALSDLRKFAKILLQKTSQLENSEDMKKLGQELLAKDFTFKKFKAILKNKRGKIKQILMNQEIIAGIGNIYSDEALWRAKIYPFADLAQLKEEELKRLYLALKEVLKRAIRLRGESISDFRDLAGRPGFFDRERKVYQREGERCSRCRTLIRRQKIGGRSCHFCPVCQKI